MDVLCHVPDEFLRGIRGAKGGTIHVDAHEMAELLARLPQERTLARGGATANTICALAHLGEDAALLAKVGDDEAGRAYRKLLAAEGADPSLLKISRTRPTGTVLSLITPDADRTMRSCLAASADFHSNDLAAGDFQGCTHLYVEGYMLYDERVVEDAARLARAAGGEVHLDLSAPEVVERHLPFLRKFIPQQVQAVYANEREAAALTGEAEPTRALAALSALCPLPVVKLGSAGVLVREGGEAVRVPARDVPAVDGTGAGDVWAAGFLHGLLRGFAPTRAARLGNLVASEIVQVTGAVLPHEAWARILRQI